MEKWHFKSGHCAATHDFERRERIDFMNDSMTAFMDEIPVMPGIYVYRARASGRGHFHMSKESPPSGGRIILGCMLGGRGSWTMEGLPEQNWRDGGRAYSMTPFDRTVSYDVSAENEWHSVAVRLEADALEVLDRDPHLPQIARAGLEGKLHDHALSRPMTGALRQVAQDLMRPAYAGAMGRLYRQSKALEFAVHQFDLLGDQAATPGEPNARELSRVRQARDRLLDDLRHPPSLDALAASVNLTPRQLNAGFRALFGTTVFDYLRDARMDAARRMLDEGLDMPLKQLGWAVGYGQVTNFVTAFRRRYGVSPGRYRSSLAESDQR
ncbi:MAG: AraC family transcriptional regulator [Mesorhizobium sp.]|nr:AraC family transcriptional regulator [Mesorhizobium sp.]